MCIEKRNDLPLVSICIPTFNRADTLILCLRDLVQNKHPSTEIIVSDNGSTDDTESVVTQFKDKRIRYFKNIQNLGFDHNVLKTVEYAKGEYVFFLSDEDFINHDSLSWLLNCLSKEKNISQLLGTVVRHDNKICTSYGDYVCKKGSESIENILFNHTYMSGIVLKKSSLDLERAKTYISCAYIFLVFQAQAMLKGDTLCTSRILCIQGPPNKGYEIEEHQISSTIGNPLANPYHYLSRVYELKEMIRLVYEICDSDKTRKILLNKLTKKATYWLSRAPILSFKPFFLKIWSIRDIRTPRIFVPYLLKYLTTRVLTRIYAVFN